MHSVSKVKSLLEIWAEFYHSMNILNKRGYIPCECVTYPHFVSFFFLLRGNNDHNKPWKNYSSHKHLSLPSRSLQSHRLDYKHKKVLWVLWYKIYTGQHMWDEEAELVNLTWETEKAGKLSAYLVIKEQINDR